MGLPFFMLGYFIQSINYKIDKIKNFTLIKLFIFIIFFFILEIVFVNLFEIQENIVITIFLYPRTWIVFILCLKNLMNNISSYSNYFKYTANFTYYAHLLFIIDKYNKWKNIHYIRQKEPKGLVHAIHCLKSFIRNERFAVLLGDDIVDVKTPCLK